MNRMTLTLLGACLAAASLTTWAQPHPAATPGIDQRQANQERRIEQGVASGELTPRETKRLEKEQVAIKRAENRAKADGVVTPKERRHLQKMQDRASQDIYRQKHDRQRTHG
jgi:hypothetical protein